MRPYKRRKEKYTGRKMTRKRMRSTQGGRQFRGRKRV
jgi:hypothetical protein